MQHFTLLILASHIIPQPSRAVVSHTRRQLAHTSQTARAGFQYTQQLILQEEVLLLDLLNHLTTLCISVLDISGFAKPTGHLLRPSGNTTRVASTGRIPFSNSKGLHFGNSTTVAATTPTRTGHVAIPSTGFSATGIPTHILRPQDIFHTLFLRVQVVQTGRRSLLRYRLTCCLLALSSSRVLWLLSLPYRLLCYRFW